MRRCGRQTAAIAAIIEKRELSVSFSRVSLAIATALLLGCFLAAGVKDDKDEKDRHAAPGLEDQLAQIRPTNYT